MTALKGRTYDRAAPARWRYLKKPLPPGPFHICRRPFRFVTPRWRARRVAHNSALGFRRRNVSDRLQQPSLLNQSTHSSVANSTCSKLRHGPRRQITSAL